MLVSKLPRHAAVAVRNRLAVPSYGSSWGRRTANKTARNRAEFRCWKADKDGYTWSGSNINMLLGHKSETGYRTVERIVVFGERDADYHVYQKARSFMIMLSTGRQRPTKIGRPATTYRWQVERREVVRRKSLCVRWCGASAVVAFLQSQNPANGQNLVGSGQSVIARGLLPMPPSLVLRTSLIWTVQATSTTPPPFPDTSRALFLKNVIQTYNPYSLKRNASPVSAKWKVAGAPWFPPKSCQAASSKRKAPTSSCSARRCWPVVSFSFLVDSAWSLVSCVFCRFPAQPSWLCFPCSSYLTQSSPLLLPSSSLAASSRSRFLSSRRICLASTLAFATS